MPNKTGAPDAPTPKIKLRFILVLQGAVLLYAISSAVAKIASSHTLFSPGFLLWYGLEIALLGIYAIIWQQVLKRTPVSVAYANRATGILWGMLLAAVLFGDDVSVQNLIGVAIVLAGILVVDSDG